VQDDMTLLDVARANLRRWRAAMEDWPPALAEWEGLLEQGAEAALAALTEQSARGRGLRQSSPFAGVLSPSERKDIFDRYESITA
jgi:hypothetical protein